MRFFIRDVRERVPLPAAVPKSGVWLRRILTMKIANSPFQGSDSAIFIVAMLARHPFSTMPPGGALFLSLVVVENEGRKGAALLAGEGMRFVGCRVERERSVGVNEGGCGS